MFQEYWEEHDINTGRHGRLSTHIASLLTLLRSQLTHHHFTEATPTLETLAMASDKAPRVVWRAGTEVLIHSGSYSRTLQLYRNFFKVRPWRVEMLLEMSFFIASHGNLEEAYECVSCQLQVNPFRSHPLCHGYCAVYQYLLHRQCSEKTVETTIDGEAETEVHLQLALKHFQSVQSIDTEFEGTANLDAFVKPHVELLLEQGQREESLALLVQYRRRHPHRLNPIRYVCDYLREHCPDTTEVRVHHLGDLVKLDESCSEVLELIELSLTAEGADIPRLFCTLLCFLDYLHNASSGEGWRMLSRLQRLWPSHVECKEWTHRQTWWPLVYAQQLATDYSGQWPPNFS